jgi:bifunctional oligoribonuclease and PAP phosphatase NrnA
MNALQEKIKDRIKAAQRVLVTSHIRPDGDAIGSSLALGLAILDVGKNVQVVLSDGLPANFKHLPGAGMIRTQADGDYDLSICVDCSDLKRVGGALNGNPKPDIVIDHHITTEAFGVLNLIEAEAVATASILVRHLPEWGLTITAPVAANLLTGLVTDTLGFRTSNTTPEALRQAANLVELGADLGSLYFKSLIRKTFPAAKYWGIGLSNLQRADGIIWTSLTLADRAAAGYTGNDDADLINLVSSIDEAEIAIMFVEQDERKTKVSWRALNPDIDVSIIASQFKGGGHKAASGAEVSGSLSEVQERILAASRQALRRIN